MPISKIGSKGIKDAELSAADIAPGTITSDKIAPGTIANDRLAGSIANAKLANSSTTINGTAIALGASGTIVAGTDWQAVVSTNTTMVSSRGYFVDSSGGAITMTLPASPSIGDFVTIIALDGSTNPVNIARNSSKIDGGTSDTSLSGTYDGSGFVYTDAANGWVRHTSTVTPRKLSATGGTVSTTGNFKIHTFNSSGNFVVSQASTTTSENTVAYMVVAGGGGGGSNNAGQQGGGGGAGGYREGKNPSVDNYTSSPLATTGLTITSGTYPITVGAAGASGPLPASVASPSGSNSIFSTITSAGGGGGGLGNPGTSGPEGAIRQGRVGGSGGGSAGSDASSLAGGAGNTPPVSPSQGFPGGPGGAGPGQGASGGGASAAGDRSDDLNSFNAGGAGTPTQIQGSPAVTYSAGGSNAGTSPRDGTAGGANTGNGGGGSSGPSGTGSAGGSGIVIIRYKYQ